MKSHFSLKQENINECIFQFQGEVTTLTGSELNSLLLSGGADGKTCIYDLNRRMLVNHLQYSSSVTCLKWLPLEVRM